MKRLTEHGLKAITVSIDDFYMPHSEFQARKQTSPTLTLHHGRGLPGTHDIALGLHVLSSLKQGIFPVRIPRYDKSAYNGVGDRCPESEWLSVQDCRDVVLFEGWMLGFRSITNASRLQTVADDFRVSIEQVEAINHHLQSYQEHWYPSLDAFVHLDTQDINIVYAWRLQQEQDLRQHSGKQCMADEEVKHFVDRFMICYRLYWPNLSLQPQSILSADRQHRCMQICIDANRQLIAK